MIQRSGCKSGHVFSVTLDDDLNDAMLKFCHEHDCSKVEFIRMAVARYLGIPGYDINGKEKADDKQ